MVLAVASIPTSIRDTLRDATANLHARVDSHMSAMFSDPTRGYERFLSASAAAVLPLEEALVEADVSDLLPDWLARSRSAALRSDLDLLALPVPHSARLQLPRKESFLMGVLYVLEGSRLGARFLLQRFQSSPASAEGRATRYLAHGRESALWQTFLRQLEASAAARRDPKGAIAGATFAFGLFLPACVQA